MRKILSRTKLRGGLLLTSFLGLFAFAYAADINIASSLDLSENAGIVNLGDVTINFGTEEVEEFGLVIGSATDHHFIFNNIEDITISGASADIDLDATHKILTFEGDFEGTIVIQGIKIRTYDQEIRGSAIGLDYTGTADADVFTTNNVSLEEDDEHNDTMYPLPVSDLSYTQNGDEVTLDWDNSPDLDVISYIVRVNKNGSFLRDYMERSKEYPITDLDFSGNTYEFEVYAKDRYYMSDPVKITIETAVPTEEENTEETVVDTGSTVDEEEEEIDEEIDFGLGDITNSPFSTEINDAYQYAYDIGITTKSSIQQADINGSLIRAHMAKMITNYTLNVIGLTPDTSKDCEFTDISNETTEMKGYIRQSCQLGLMGQNSTKFNPSETVTRAQFGTILSRALYGSEYENDEIYYIDHLDALYDNGIIKNTDPNLMETRGYVMLMLMRAEE